jgi:uncharacterized phage protein (TIGR01671 family)
MWKQGHGGSVKHRNYESEECMREIKYRAFWYEDKVITAVDTIEFLQGGIRVLDGCWHIGWAGKDCELLQFTGLRDKNKKEIYESYIVKFTNPIDEIDSEIGVCKFEQDECNFVLQYKGYRNDHYALHTIYLISNVTYECSYEVIGNIYENPELVKIV